MKPNFEEMTNKELIAYALAHRDDLEALQMLYQRRTPDEEATWYPAVTMPDGTPIEANIHIMETAIKKRIEQSN
ncbi:hypothetical protein VB715_16605 [Crocosphaera sp. UHCC 0190]|uniref:DUF6887 family protein n=1 Tax=Crocosphaera sp. UHCC 0190 TaxID=3110246 RepID=UPI002B221833|nr:hypothetical protein [Crocosphaera sp. UHCC 0190]MEA5511397.1 hypothetical protein [Crocosphaera sp. UHCC 0190]